MQKAEGQIILKIPGSFLSHVLFFTCLLLFRIIFPITVIGEIIENTDENVPLWWPDTQKRAEAAGYKLINLLELQALMQSEKEVVLLDVRPDYEYREGHMPGALNFEFHLGHRSGLATERAEALKSLLGEDRDRLVVAYCRNFR